MNKIRTDPAFGVECETMEEYNLVKRFILSIVEKDVVGKQFASELFVCTAYMDPVDYSNYHIKRPTIGYNPTPWGRKHGLPMYSFLEFVETMQGNPEEIAWYLEVFPKHHQEFCKRWEVGNDHK